MQPENFPFFYELLSHALWQANKPIDPEDFPLPPAENEWQEVLGYARAHSVAGIFSKALSLLPETWRPEQELLSSVTKIISDDDHAYRRHADELPRLYSLLHTCALTPIFFRSAVWASYYPQPEHLRIHGLAAFITPAQQQAAIRCMTESGATEKENRAAWEKRYLLQGVYCQLFFKTGEFRCPHSRHYYRELEAQAMQNSQLCKFHLDGNWLPTFSPLFSIICQTACLQRQLILGRITLRQICDWTMLLYSERTALGIAENQLIRHLNRLGLQRLYDALGNLARHHLGLPNSSYAALHTSAKEKASGDTLYTFLTGTPHPGDISNPLCPAQEKWSSKISLAVWLFRQCWHLRHLCPRECFFTPWAELKTIFFPPRRH